MQLLVKANKNSFALTACPQSTIGSMFANAKIYSQGQLLFPEQSFNQLSENAVLHIIPNIRGGMQIFVRQLNGVSFVVDAESDQIKAKDLKQLIYNQVHVPAENQNLYCAGKLLLDDHPLSEYEISNEAVVHLILNTSVPSVAVTPKEDVKQTDDSHFQVMVQLSNKDDNIVIPLEKKENTTLYDIKEAISAKRGIDIAYITLNYQGKPLSNDSLTLKEQTIQNNATLVLVVKLK